MGSYDKPSTICKIMEYRFYRFIFFDRTNDAARNAGNVMVVI